ncbi:hypothetical protein ACMD2_11327 [Ananas comosus]|uniref:Uncharacterized protein n=1 Tax=Ananas comosus TaxID=4615 RepID=A0A199VEP4_ANACO|nr:hypothetical protein ACMD2_11327 [Ananas comosus]
MASSSSSSPFSHLPSPPASGGTSAAVDAIIAEAMDLCALEHIAALNTAHLPRDSALLPSHLESRFRSLKSFPAAHNGAPPPPPLHRTRSAAAPASTIEPRTPTTTGKDPAVVAGKGSKPNSPSGLSPPPPIAPRSSRRGGVSPSPSPSPPRRHTSMCCFAFSPKKSAASSQRSGGSGGGKGTGDLGIGDWESNDRIVAELKEQRRKLKKALQEQAKARSEAAKIVRLAKQASARMSTFTIDDDDDDDELLSDEDEEELFK